MGFVGQQITTAIQDGTDTIQMQLDHRQLLRAGAIEGLDVCIQLVRQFSRQSMGILEGPRIAIRFDFLRRIGQRLANGRLDFIKLRIDPWCRD